MIRRAIPRRAWVGLAAAFVVALLAGLLGNVLGGLVPDENVAGEFAISHLIPLPIEIVLLLLFARYSGWGRDLWREVPTTSMHPRRGWLIVIPVSAVLLPISQFGEIPWTDQAFSFVLLITVGTLMVGFTEELTMRGVLLTAVRGRHGEFVTLVTTSVIFALAHVPSDVINGVPLGAIVIQFFALCSVGSTYYWVRRVTGSIWPAIIVHALTDWTLYLASGPGVASEALTSGTGPEDGLPVTVTTQFLLWGFGIAGLISVVHEDARTRRHGRQQVSS